jgi:hypothetical protein
MTSRFRQRRTADPYRDLDVVDSRAPRFNQATVGLVSVIAILSGAWWLFGLLAAQLIVGLTLGRKYCLPCAFYFEVVQPRWGEGPVEDARPPRFANILGAVFLTGATTAHVVGLHPIGWILGGMVAALALLAAITGLCVGCEIYRIAARLRGVRPGSVHTLDLTELGASANGTVVVQFTHPLCTDCHHLERTLTAEGRKPVLVDVTARPELARKYHVSIVPTAFALASDGRVLERLA